MDLTLKDCRPEVLAFALLMERELRANDHKPGWKADRPAPLSMRVTEEARELETAAFMFQTGAPPPFNNKGRALVAEEAADVANMAMMVADVCGCLPPVPIIS